MEIVDDASHVLALAAVEFVQVTQGAGRVACGAEVAAQVQLILTGRTVGHARVQHDALVVDDRSIAGVRPTTVALVM